MSEEIIARWQDPTIEKLQQENKQLKDRINKAVEYIEENCSADNRLNLKIILKGDKE